MSLVRVITHLLCHVLHVVKEQRTYLTKMLSLRDTSTHQWWVASVT